MVLLRDRRSLDTEGARASPGRTNRVVAEIDKLFSQRFDDLVNSMQLGKPPRGSGGGHGGGHGGGRKPRHLH
jgi:hypothetical protein